MRSTRECPIDGCTAELRGFRLMCGGHWHRLPLDMRADLHRAAVSLERREQAADRNGWTADRVAATQTAAEHLTLVQCRAIIAVELVEGVLTGA